MALVLLAGWRCTDAEAASLSPLLRDLARGAGEYRSIAPRLSISRGYAPCRETPPPADGTVTRAACPAMPAEAASSRSVRRVSAAAGDAGVEPDALHAGALIDLLWGGTGRTLARAIQSLHTAARLSERPAPLLADLAAAYLLRAERMQTPGDLDRALEAAAEAMELDSANTAALYNRALALERIGLADAADDAWRTYLRVDDASGWADEARAWLRHTVVADVAPPPAPTPATAAEFARRAPQQANAWGWETLLPAWAAARQAGNAAAADSALRLAESVGAALVRDRRDATLADAVAVLRAADAATLVRLANGHRAYGEARRLYEAGDRPAAEPLFARAAADGAGSPSLQMWARLFRGAALAYSADPAAVPEIHAVVAEADSVRHPALAGRARWILGNTLAIQNRHEEARNWFVRSARLMERAGEDEHLGFVQFLAANSLHRMGSEAAADHEGHRAMLRLRAYPRSGWRHVVLVSAATRAHESGLSFTALQYHAEDIRVTEQAGKPVHIAEARAARARLLTALGQTEAALRDVMTIGPLVPQLRAEAQEWARHDMLEARAAHRLHNDPAGAAILLDSVVEFHARRPPRLLSALLTRAQTRLATGNEPGARADLQAAADVILERATAIRTTHLRSTLFEQARHVFDQMVMASVAAGDHLRALEQMEYARAVFARLPRDPSVRARPVGGEAAIQYAVIGDTLLTWVVTVDTVRLVRQIADGRRLVRAVEHIRSSLELRRSNGGVQRELADLYDLLIRPLALHGRDALLIVSDGPLAALPFAALYDRQRGRYLVEDHPIRLAPMLTGRDSPAAARPSRNRALLIADPAFDRGEHPGYHGLPHAREEVAAIAGLYPSAQRLQGNQADRARVIAELAAADVVHFAGHAVLDDTRPERSFLLLTGAGGSGRLTAEQIGGLDLRGVRLVVLSACETARGTGERSGGMTGLSAALMDAGAEGVLGSLWRVDDQLTRVLMVEFHRAYRESGDPAAALRTAQLRLVRSADAELRSPAAWAAFVHAGN